MATLDNDGLNRWRERLGRLGVWSSTEGYAAAEAAAYAARLEGWGYSTLWLPEAVGRDPFAQVAHLAHGADSLLFATGIANIHHRLPGVMLMGANTVAEQSAGRFVLGLGVSHAPMVEGIRHLSYDKPLATMRAYLKAYDESFYMAPPPPDPVPRVLAALGPKMIELAGEMADGVHPYWTTPAHTAQARQRLGADKLICVEQKVVLTDDREEAHETIRTALGYYLGFPNYRNNWLRLGFADEQIDGFDPQFLEALVVWGDIDAIRARVAEHHDAGADHVCIQAITPGTQGKPDEGALAALAPG